MLYLKMLRSVTENELQAVGHRAMDLARLSVSLPTAPSFVVLSTAFDETVRQNNLKYKIDYILGHAQVMVHQSLVNTYNSVRKAFLEAKLPNGLETELRETYNEVTAPLRVGELVAANDLPPVRVIVSQNRFDDPENNDTIIQNINSYEELLLAVREAWALSYHPSQLGGRLRDKFPDNRLKVALIVQVMEKPESTVHLYSCLPQDHHKIYAQAYNGYPDLREKVSKDYYAVSKEQLRVITSQVRPQKEQLERNENKELLLAPLNHKYELLERDLIELSRLTKKAERLLKTPVKAFFTTKDGEHSLLWANRLGFDILIKDDEQPETPAQQPAPPSPTPTPQQTPTTEPVSAQALIDEAAEPAVATEPAPAPVEDFLVTEEPEPAQAPAPTPTAPTPSAEVEGVAAKLLSSSLHIVRQVVERKYRSAFGETPVATESLADMINKLNSASAFSRAVDGALLLQAEEAAKTEGHISSTEYAKAIEEVSFLMTYA